jgi:hypothetical protein
MRSGKLLWQACVCANMHVENIEYKENTFHGYAAAVARGKETKMAAFTLCNSLFVATHNYRPAQMCVWSFDAKIVEKGFVILYNKCVMTVAEQIGIKLFVVQIKFLGKVFIRNW